MNLIKATINDLDAVTELFDLYRQFYEQSPDTEGAREFLKTRILNGESVIFVAYEGGEAVGFTQLYPTFSSVSMQRSWILNDLYVKKEYRGKGIGDKLINKAIEMARDTGAKGVLLETASDNFPAQGLYEKIGFKRETHYFYYFSI
ncbi:MULTISPECIES: GNAT family N-acetyltransferase [Neobacillus]|uniref:GNAT family N-acetyltransferase n=1 Tax=Neobacillus rhizophilus TaxID=2833579 RepID=A0A942YSJ4_9BACI|nr:MULTISPECIES: GNAT family N-acetyltransferase [Neobacillus]MBS4211199.1 GNAT family N-acetyltransferase [Neobacillus rhizophilus]MBU8918723.1 GNAT family N-acetyltransferase [Bacillus sp. FJAT-29953]